MQAVGCGVISLARPGPWGASKTPLPRRDTNRACHPPGEAGRGQAGPGCQGAQLWGVWVSWLQDGTVHLVYGVLEEPFRTLEAINTSGLQTGLQRVQLLKPSIPIPALPVDTHTMEIRTPDVLIPDQPTTYWCHITELPDGFSRHHIVMVPGGGGGGGRRAHGGRPGPQGLVPALLSTWGFGGACRDVPVLESRPRLSLNPMSSSRLNLGHGLNFLPPRHPVILSPCSQPTLPGPMWPDFLGGAKGH